MSRIASLAVATTDSGEKSGFTDGGFWYVEKELGRPGRAAGDRGADRTIRYTNRPSGIQQVISFSGPR